MRDRWVDIVRTPPVASANWVALPENGWGAIIAYRVGPGRARPHDVPLALRQVTETCTEASGTTRRQTVAMGHKDSSYIAESVNSYLRDVGLPPTPFTWWDVAPPDGMTGGEFLRRVENASAEGVTATSGVEVARQYATALADEVAKIFIPADPFD